MGNRSGSHIRPKAFTVSGMRHDNFEVFIKCNRVKDTNSATLFKHYVVNQIIHVFKGRSSLPILQKNINKNNINTKV